MLSTVALGLLSDLGYKRLVRKACIVAILVVACGRGGCGRKTERPKPASKAAPRQTGLLREIVAERPNDKGVRLFQPPRGQEVLAFSASPQNDLLLAVSTYSAFLFRSADLPAKIVELPGMYNAPIPLSLSRRRAAVAVSAPTVDPEGRLFLFDAEAGRLISDQPLGGTPKLGVALANERFVLVSSDPPGILLVDGNSGKTIRELDAPSGPIRSTENRRWSSDNRPSCG